MLVVFDTDKIKEYVFATNKLKEIEGASAILTHLNKEGMEEEVKGICDGNFEKIYADGGGAVFIVPDDKADEVIDAIKRLYIEETKGGASITGVKYKIKGNNYDFKKVSEAIRREKETKLAERKINGGTVSQLSLPYMRFCDSCGRNYATKFEKNPDGEEEWLCPVCLKKRETLGKLESPNEKIIKKIKVLEGIPISKSFDDIASEDGYIATIYVDGNEIGKEMESIKTLNELKVFSQKMDRAMEQAVIKAIEETLNNAGIKNFKKVPFKVLLLAGDDLVLSINANLAFPVAVKIAENFEKHFEVAKKLSLSIGIVISHKNFPFRQALNYAISLLSYTKKKRAEIKILQGKSVDSMISFVALSAAIPLSPSRYFKEYLSIEKSKKQFQLTAQPYTIKQMNELISYIQLLKKNKFPKTKLLEIEEAVYKGGFRTVIELYSIITRLNENNRNILEELVRGKNLNFPSSFVPPWFISSSNITFTHLLDVANMYRFIIGG